MGRVRGWLRLRVGVLRGVRRCAGLLSRRRSVRGVGVRVAPDAPGAEAVAAAGRGSVGPHGCGGAWAAGDGGVHVVGDGRVHGCRCGGARAELADIGGLGVSGLAAGAPLLALGIPDFVWEARERLRCRDDPDSYFAEGVRPRQAKVLCVGCAYLDECAAYALARPELLGVWGGTTARERRSLRRRPADGLAAAS
ncbi:WhiB family transcriptional regulator [Streptomyces griseofuscus]|uniref:WhiB family transcriptional regulator n=1 Tax=Streptomyces griseofuscus TaxID=146922 RepID=UPI0036B478B7